MTDKQIVLTTAATQDEARKIAYALVERKLAACINIVPQIESVYRWEGRIESSQEWLLLIKTDNAHFEAVRDAIRELDSYEVPECIAVSIEDGGAEYFAWMEKYLE